MKEAQALLRKLPSVDRLLAHERTGFWLASLGRSYVTQQCREVLDELRSAIGRGDRVLATEREEDSILELVARRIDDDEQSGLVGVVNATGTILHTNLGRALLPRQAVDAICRVADQPSNLEYDLAQGARGKREAPI